MRISDWSSDVCSSDLDGSARSWLRQDRTQLRNGLRSSSGQCHVVASPCRQSAAGQSHGFRFGYATAVVTQGAAMMQKDASVGGKAPELGTDRKSGGEGTSVYVRVDPGGRRIIKKKQKI